MCCSENCWRRSSVGSWKWAWEVRAGGAPGTIDRVPRKKTLKVPKRGFPSRVVVGDEEERFVEEALRGGRGEDGGSRAPGEGAVGVFELRRDGVGACDDGQGDGEEEGVVGGVDAVEEEVRAGVVLLGGEDAARREEGVAAGLRRGGRRRGAL